MKKNPYVVFVCDLCDTESTEPSETDVPVGWVAIVNEPVDRTFVTKHVCERCVNLITVKLALGGK